jgi:hypothetical protein
MSKKKTALVLGYTRTGREVLRPTSHTPALEDFVGWSRCDHIDASRILQEHGERETDEQASRRCTRWAEVHQSTARPPRRANIRGSAEIAILSRRGR